MKNLFKKSNKKAVVKTQTLDKKQLSQVIGGAETFPSAPKSTPAHEAVHTVQQ